MARSNHKAGDVRGGISAERAKEIMSSTPKLTDKALAELAEKKRKMGH